MATQQETFDIVARHLLTQKVKCLNPDYRSGAPLCLYRRGDLRCAVGVLIPDDAYDPNMEGGQPWAPHRYSAEFDDSDRLVWDVVVEAGGHDPALCNELQEIHDNEPVDLWAQRLREVAFSVGLSTAVIDEALR